MNFLAEAQNLEATLVGYRRHFHMHPELSGKENETAAYITDQLIALGIEILPETSLLPGVVGLLKGKKSGKTVALRADMDALAITEKNEIAYKSQNNGVMHACGHDAHMAILLGAAHILSGHREAFSGNVKFVFQPSEEIYGGALPMIEAGVLENPHVDAIFGLHMDPAFKTGEVGICYGETLASSDRLNIIVKGKSSHGTSPHKSVDSIVVAAHLVLALQTVVSRLKDPLQAGVLSIGVIEGGKQHNAIAEEVMLKGILRTFSPEVRESCIANIDAIARGLCQTFNAGCEFVREKSYDSLINHDFCVDRVKEAATAILSAASVIKLNQPRLIVEDFAYYLQRIPGAYYFLGSGDDGGECSFSLHSSSFNIDERALPVGAALQTALAVNFLNQDA